MKRLDLVIPLRDDLAHTLEQVRREAPSLAALIRHGRESTGEASVAACLCRHFEVPRQHDWPLAPITARADGLEVGGDYWLRLDPAHLEIGMGGLLLHPADEVGIGAEEAGELAAALRSSWAEADIELLAPTPTRWYLRQPTAPRLTTTPLDQAAGVYLGPHLPGGADARRLMRLVNEAQMLLHAHPVNQAREARGQASINGLWLWGGGRAPPPGRGPDVIADRRELSRAMAAFAGVEAIPCPASLAAGGAWRGAARVLAILPEAAPEQAAAERLAVLERDWLRPLLRALRRGRPRQAGISLLTRPALHVELDTLGSWACKLPAFVGRSQRADD